MTQFVIRAYDGKSMLNKRMEVRPRHLRGMASKRGIFEGDIETGELEIGQIVSTIKDIKPVTIFMDELISDFEDTKQRMSVVF